MASITKVTPLAETRQGGFITITGTGFGATQGLGTAKAGGKALTDITWSDTVITGKLASDCPFGSQDVEVEPNSGQAVTLQNGIYCYSSTNNKAAAKLGLGIVDEVFLNGIQIGFTQDALDFIFSVHEISFEPMDRFDLVQLWSYVGPMRVRLTLSQLYSPELEVNGGPVLAKMIGAAWDSTSRMLTLSGNGTLGDLSLFVKEASGIQHVCKRVRPTGDITLSLNKEVKNLPMEFHVLSLDDPSLKKYESYIPA